MPRLDLETLRALDAPLRLPHRCANPFCTCKVVYVGQFCCACRVAQEKEREFLRLKKEAKG